MADTANVPVEYLQDSGTKFKIGMDARYRGDLIRSVTGETNDAMLCVFEKNDAMARLEERGWTKFLPEEHRTPAPVRRGRPRGSTSDPRQV